MVTKDEIKAALLRSNLFKGLDDNDLKALSENVQIKTFSHGEVIFKQNSAGFESFMVHSGRISIVRDGILMAHFDAGQIFGEFSMLDGSPYTASAISEGDSVLLSLNRDAFYAQVSKSPSLAQKVIHALVKRLKRHLII